MKKIPMKKLKKIIYKATSQRLNPITYPIMTTKAAMKNDEIILITRETTFFDK